MTTWHLDLYAEPDGLFLAALDDSGAIVAIGRVERCTESLHYDVETTFDRMLSCCAEYPDSISTDRAEVFVRFGSLFRLTQYVRDARSNAWVERRLRAALDGVSERSQINGRQGAVIIDEAAGFPATTREAREQNSALISAFFWLSAVFIMAFWATLAWAALS
ncbi:MAG: hypothetical protein ACOY45_02720 [Pseudomonadota bacterium]